MKKLVFGILAHVDAGKTTLSESMLFLSGKIRQIGRVDNKDAYLDTYAMEKARGITIFSKQAVLKLGDINMTLVDTPGHVDFSTEMERTLQILDYAILVINASDGIQGHTKTLWHLLERYHVPTFIFVNKMDQPNTDRKELIEEIQTNLSDMCIPFDVIKDAIFYEQIAMADEALMDLFIAESPIEDNAISECIVQRKIFPIYFGSALYLEGVNEFAEGISRYSLNKNYSNQFSARVFKITRDEQGNRLTHMKITGGCLKVKSLIGESANKEKVNQIRIYSGEKYEAFEQVEAGSVCAVTGLSSTVAGQGIGGDFTRYDPIIEPVLSYNIELPSSTEAREILPKLMELQEEEPSYYFEWDSVHSEIKVRVMGEVQIEVLKYLIKEKYGISIELGEGRIVYKETIDNTVEGVGHFEPLRHYSEVHLILSSQPMGSGIVFDTACSEDILDKNWQRAVLTHLKEKQHVGVLIGALITDMKITLVSGRAHNKHTVGGDFREATYRAVRQGLMEAESRLLEPYYSFELHLPEAMIGRAMNDIERLYGMSEIVHNHSGNAILRGRGPVSTLNNYHKEVIAYTKGQGQLFMTLDGYDYCHNENQVIAEMGYNAEMDLANPCGSVFCAHGSGFNVPWNEVKNHMHVEGVLKSKRDSKENIEEENREVSREQSIGLDEIDHIINSTYNANSGNKSQWKKQRSAKEDYYKKKTTEPITVDHKNNMHQGKVYLLVDGYNIIYVWDELNGLVHDHMDAARMKLLDILSNYQGVKQWEVIVVFDAYRVEGRMVEMEKYNNIHVVFTGEAQTADHYIEKFAYDNKGKYRMIVATSDGLQQIIIRGAGCGLMSARELKEDVDWVNRELKESHQMNTKKGKMVLENALTQEEINKMKKMTD